MGKSGEAMGNMRIFSTHIISCPLKKAENNKSCNIPKIPQSLPSINSCIIILNLYAFSLRPVFLEKNTQHAIISLAEYTTNKRPFLHRKGLSLRIFNIE
jgi:hypothetical protein